MGLLGLHVPTPKSLVMGQKNIYDKLHQVVSATQILKDEGYLMGYRNSISAPCDNLRV